MPEPTDLRATVASLGTRVVGREFHHVERTGSTNEDLKRRARAGAPEGLVLSADEQTEGRGRRGRTWVAPPGSSLLLSILLRPAWLPPIDGFFLTILGAVAGAEAVEQSTGLAAELKWPNDLELGGRKIGGILAETEVGGAVLQWTVIGIGLNVNWDPSGLPEIAMTATSLSRAAGRELPRAPLLRALLQRLDHWYLELRAGRRDRLFDAWRRRLTTLGQTVSVDRAGATIHGVAEGVTAQGALLVRDHAGTTHELTAGEVTVRRSS